MAAARRGNTPLPAITEGRDGRSVLIVGERDGEVGRCSGTAACAHWIGLAAPEPVRGLPIALKLTEGPAHDGRSAAEMLGSVGRARCCRRI